MYKPTLLALLVRAVHAGTNSSYRSSCLARGYAEEWCDFQFHSENVADIWQGCNWKAIRSKGGLEWAPLGARASAYESAYAPSEAHRCILDAGEEGDWHIERYGMLTTYGGNEWWRFTTLNPLDHLEPGKEYDVLAFFMGHHTADDDTRLLPYPPLHEHHTHILDGTLAPMCCDKGIMLHGDDQCGQEDGATSCYLSKYPNGWKTQLKMPISIFTAEFNDVRPKTSVPLVTYQIHGYLIAKDGLTRKMAGMSSWRQAEELIHGTSDWRLMQDPQNIRYYVPEPFQPYHSLKTERLTIPIHANPQRSLFWSHAPFVDYQGAMDVQFMYAHRHQGWLEDFWIWRGTRDFTPVLGAPGEFTVQEWALGLSPAAVYEQLLAAAGAEPFCQLSGSFVTEHYSAEETCELDRTHYRKATPCHKTAPFMPFEELTIVALAQPRGSGAAAAGAGANTHFNFRFFGECKPEQCVRPNWFIMGMVLTEGDARAFETSHSFLPAILFVTDFLATKAESIYLYTWFVKSPGSFAAVFAGLPMVLLLLLVGVCIKKLRASLSRRRSSESKGLVGKAKHTKARDSKADGDRTALLEISPQGLPRGEAPAKTVQVTV